MKILVEGRLGVGSDGSEGNLLHSMKGIYFTTQIERDNPDWTECERRDLRIGKETVLTSVSGNARRRGKSQKNAGDRDDTSFRIL